jgi:hypothetical protein
LARFFCRIGQKVLPLEINFATVGNLQKLNKQFEIVIDKK